MTVTARDILHRLADLGAEAYRQGDKLILRAGTAPVPKGILAQIRAHKAEFLQELSADAARDDSRPCAGLVNAGTRASVACSEGYARLDPDRPPRDVPPTRWQRFVEDVRLFIDSPFCAFAVSLGWGPHDLFGCDGDRPFARIDQAGLIWLLRGDRLIAITENTGTIETPTGARQTYRRKVGERDRVLAWEVR